MLVDAHEHLPKRISCINVKSAYKIRWSEFHSGAAAAPAFSRAATPQGNEIHVSETHHWKSHRQTPPASIFHVNVEKQHPHALISWSVGVSKPNWLGKKPVVKTNVHVSRKSKKPTKSPITMAGNRSEKCPRCDITLKHSALRVMCRNKRDAATQWNSRQRMKFIENHTFSCHQRQYLIKTLKSSIRMHWSLASFSASPVGRMLWFPDLWVYLNPIDLEKKPVVKTNVHLLRTVNRQPWFPCVGLVKTIAKPKRKKQ